MPQQNRLIPLLAAVREMGWRVEVETNGTIPPSPSIAHLVDQFNVSPKLANSGIAEERRVVDAALAAYVACGCAVFKFVVKESGDLDEVDRTVERHALHPVYVMPEAIDADGVLAGMRRLAEPALERGYRLTTRLHVLLWGDVRGR